jgi:hypothetical protein
MDPTRNFGAKLLEAKSDVPDGSTGASIQERAISL